MFPFLILLIIEHMNLLNNHINKFPQISGLFSCVVDLRFKQIEKPWKWEWEKVNQGEIEESMRKMEKKESEGRKTGGLTGIQMYSS